MLRARSTRFLRVVLGLAAACVAWLLTTTPTFGQSTTATVRGTVEDPSGGILPGANVTMTNTKLRTRGVHMLREILGVSLEEAEKLSEGSGGKLKVAVLMGATGCSRKDAEQRLESVNGNLRKILGHMGSGRE